MDPHSMEDEKLHWEEDRYHCKEAKCGVWILDMVKFLTVWLCADYYNFLRLFPSAVKEKDNFPKLLTVDKEDVHTHTKKHCSAIKKNENNVICSNMARPRDYHSKWSKSEKTNVTGYHLRVEFKIWYKWIF